MIWMYNINILRKRSCFKKMMKEQVFEQLKTAMKEKNVLAKGVLQLLKSGLENAEKEKQLPLTPEEEVAIVQREVKQTKQALEGAVQAGREDLIEKENAKIALLEQFLPKQLSVEEVEKALVEAGITVGMNMGQGMKIAKPLLNGKAENAIISATVKKLITA